MGITTYSVKYSILIPVYNAEKYIAECLESVLSQKICDYEVVIIDDGSTDKSLAICQEYSQKNPQIRLYSQVNGGGIFYTREKLLNYAKGEYSLFLDADDYWEKDLLQKVEQVLGNNGYDCLLFDWNMVEEGKDKKQIQSNGCVAKTLFTDSNKKDLFSVFINAGTLNNLWSKVFKTDILKGLNFQKYPNIKMGEDMVMVSYLFENSRTVYNLGERLYNYRILNSSLTRTFLMYKKGEFVVCYEAVKQSLVNLGYDKDEKLKKQLITQVLNSFAGTIMYAQTKIIGRENEFVTMLKILREDEKFIDLTGKYLKEQSFVTKLPIKLLINGKYSTILFLRKLIQIGVVNKTLRKFYK